MTIINDEFLTLTSGYTIRIDSILAINIEAGYIWVDEIGYVFTETSDVAAALHAHWIRVISARMGVHHSPAETPSKEPTHEAR